MPAYHREATLLSIKLSLCKTSDKRRHMTRQVPPHRARLWQMGTTCVFGSRSKVKKKKNKEKKSLLVVFRQRHPRWAPPLPSLLSSCSQLSDELTSVADGGVHESRLQGRCGDLRRDYACVTTWVDSAASLQSGAFRDCQPGWIW